MNIEHYAYLWDGSEEGWVLHCSDHVVWKITYTSSPEGPGKDEILALRKVVPEFRDMTLSLVLKRLQGVQNFTDETTYDHSEAKRLESELGNLGLTWKMDAEHVGGYLPVRNETMALLIEDEQTCIAVCEKMIEAGVPVKRHPHADQSQTEYCVQVTEDEAQAEVPPDRWTSGRVV